MSETVKDIIGKGFKYELREEITQLTEVISGTIAAFVGGANWGPIDKVTQIVNEFESKFGTPIDKYDLADTSGLALNYHLNASPLAWFIRVADGSQQKAKKTITKQAKPATVVGTEVVKDQTYVIKDSGAYQNNKLKINIGGGDDITLLDNYSLSFPALTKITIDREISGVHDPLWALATFTEAGLGQSWAYPDSSSASGPVISLPIELPEDDNKLGWVYVGNVYGDVGGVETIVSTFKWDTNLPEGTVEITTWVAEADVIAVFGSHEAGYGTKVGSDSSGSTAVPYWFKINGQEYTFTATAAMTFTQIAAAMAIAPRVGGGNTVTDDGYVVTFVDADNAIKVRKLLAATGSNVTLTAGSTGANLFSTLTGWVAFKNAVSGVTEVDLGGKYILVNSPTNSYYAWFKKTGSVDPAISGKIGIEIAITSGDVANTIATTARNAIGAMADLTASGSSANITITCVDAGACTNGTAGNSGWSSVTVSQTGADATPWTGDVDADTLSDATYDVLLAGNAPSYNDGDQEITITTSNGTNNQATEYDLNTVEVILDKTPTCSPFTSEDLTSITLGGTTGNIAAGAVIDFSIDGNSFTYVVKAETKLTGETIKVKDFTELSTAVSGGASDTYATRFMKALKRYIIQPQLGSLSISGGVVLTTLADPYVTSSVDYKQLIIQSQNQGAESIIKMYNMPIAFPSITTASPSFSTSVDTDIEDILSVYETDFNGKANVYLNIDNQIVFSTLDTGAAAEITVLADGVGTIYSLLGLSVMSTPNYGVDGVSDGGTLEAYYTGTEGNTIKLVTETTQDGTSASIFFQGNLVERFFNFSYTKTSSEYIGTMINSSEKCSTIVTFAGGAEDVNGNIATFEAGEITLVGGKSGCYTGTTPIADYKYTRALDEYKNLDLYSIDLLCVSGNSSVDVSDKVQEVCEYRMDCIGIVDPPETVAGYDTGSVQKMISWHNGLGYGRSEKFDSKYVATYFPWLLIPVANTTNPKQWLAPSVRAVGAISNADYVSGHKQSAPAGFARTTLSNVDALAKYLREDDKQRLYADELGNSINPIVFTTDNGFFIDGQKNTDRNFRALSRLNVMRTAVYMKKRMYSISPKYFWRPLVGSTFTDLEFDLKQLALELYQNSAIKDDFEIIVDTSINTQLIEIQRGLIGIIKWTPVRSVEKFKIISVVRDAEIQVVFG